MSKAQKIGKIVVSVLLWLVILLAALFAFVTLAGKDQTHLASIGGVTPLTVNSDSMKPTFEKGDLIFIRKVDPKNLQVGDIVTFHTIIDNEYALNTHRIVSIDTQDGQLVFTTQGDNNALKDKTLVTSGDIAGQYFKTAKTLGKIINVISSKLGFFIIIVLPMLLFFIYQIYHLIMVSIELKKANAIEAAIESDEINNKKLSDAEKALEEAKRIQAEAEAALARAKQLQEENDKNN